MIPILVVSLLAGFVLGYLAVTRPRKKPYFASAEYWVFLPGTEMPEHDVIMTEMISLNPYSIKGRSPIGPPEGLIFSDVRLHIALVLRSRNPHAFRPDIFEDVDEAPLSAFTALAEANSFVKLRYISEDPLKDKRHLQFLIHAADTVARLGSGTVIYDRIAATLQTQTQIASLLKQNFDATTSSVQVRTTWVPHASGGHLASKGLMKVGLSEIVTDVLEADQKLIAKTVLEEAIVTAWNNGVIPDPWEVEAYGDRFQILPKNGKGRTTQVRILRVQSV